MKKNLGRDLGMIVLLTAVCAGAAGAQNFEAEASWDATSLTEQAKSGRDRSAAEISAMKTASRAVEAPVESDSENFTGDLTISAGPGSAKLPFKNGPAGVRCGKPASSSFFSGDRTMSLAQGSHLLTFAVGKSAFKSFGDFATDADFQRFALHGTQASRETGTWDRNATVSCTHAGYCYGCGLNFNGKMDCGYRFHTSCSGTKSVLEKVTGVETVTTVEIISRETGRAVGKIIGAPENSERVEIVADQSSCD